MKQKLLIVLMMLANLHGSAQSIDYNYEQNDPYAYNYSASLHLFDADFASKQSIYLGYGIQASVAVKKLFTAEFLFNHAYSPVFDWNYHWATKSIYTVATTNKPKHYGAFELGGMFHLMDKVSSKRRKVVLSSFTSGRRTTTHYVRVPTDVRRIIGLRGGLYRNAFAINDQDHGSVKGSIGDGGVIATDGTEFGAAVTDFNSPFYNTRSVSNMTMNGFYVGICKAEFYNVAIHAGGYGLRANRTYMKLFADMIIAPPRIEDFHAWDGKDYQVHGGNSKGFETRPYGARVGYEVIRYGKSIAFNGHTEFGFRPGFKASKYYLAVGFGLSWRGKIKALSSEKK